MWRVGLCGIFGWYGSSTALQHNSLLYIRHPPSVCFFIFVMISTFHSSPAQRRWLCSLSCSSSLDSFLGYNWSQNLSRSCYSPKWTGIVSLHMSSCTLSPPEPCIFTSLCSFTHINTCIFCYSHHSLLCSLMYWNPFSIFSPLCSNLHPCWTLFSSVPSVLHFLFSPLLSFPAPSILLHTGGESTLPTEQHRCGGQRHVSALCQPGYCISLRGRNLGQETPAQDRTGT